MNHAEVPGYVAGEQPARTATSRHPGGGSLPSSENLLSPYPRPRAPRPEGPSSAPADGAGRPPRPHRLGLLGAFELVVASQRLQIAVHAQRMLALLAIRRAPVNRRAVAHTLWPETLESRAKAKLRSVLWRLQECRRTRVIELSGSTLALAPGLWVDLHEATCVAERLVDRSRHLDERELHDVALTTLTGDLLPHMCDESWLTADQERFRQLRLHALEALCDRLADIGSYSAALNAGLAAMCADPMRESARRAVIRAFLLEGNRSDAVRQLESYRRLLRKELGIEPSPELTRLVILGTTRAP